MRPKGSAAVLEQRRRLAISLLEQGMKPARVASVSGGVKTHESRRLENVNELGGMSGQDAGMVG